MMLELEEIVLLLLELDDCGLLSELDEDISLTEEELLTEEVS